ncbi:b(0,+)-type amino acid transporter 1-like isoform X3 [Dermacentor variabilis]|uniref:b(0,+)-type amino acid transporter 1-like isoform X3 n=1 Tax=Dermacentor variabilis TaxID=34621 RepID=UPI003F5AE397
MGSAVSQQDKAPKPSCASPAEDKAKDQTPASPQETPSAVPAEKAALKRQVGLGSGVALIIGSIIGSGIFVTPSSVFRNSGSIGVDLLVWIVCGILSIIALATAVNCFSVKTSARVQDIFSSIKCLILISVIITGAVFAFKVTHNHFQDEALFSKPESASRLVLAFYGALYSYGGWKQICLIAEEVTEPNKNILRATMIGILAVTAIYVLTNVAYFVVLDPNTFATSEAIAVSFTASTWGVKAAGVIPVAVSISTFGTLCAGFFSAARVILAASRQGHLAPVFSCITVHSSTPVAAIMLRGSLALAFTFIGSISYLIEGSVFLENVWEIVVLLCLFSLRYTMKDAHRPYAVPLPLAVVKFLVSVALVVIPLLRPVDYVQYVVILAMLVAGGVYYAVFVAFSCSVPGTKPLTRFIQKLLLSAPCTNDLEIMLKEKL